MALTTVNVMCIKGELPVTDKSLELFIWLTNYFIHSERGTDRRMNQIYLQDLFSIFRIENSSFVSGLGLFMLLE